MQLREYARCDAIGLRALLAAGEVTAAEVEAVARQALELANDQVNGLAMPLFSPALARADGGPLAGVPFLIKDSGPMAEGVPFFLGSRSLPGAAGRHDSDLMRRIRAAGLVTLGLTTAPELALSFSTEPLRTGPTRNPWDVSRGVGGSSGGAAALVAAGAVPLAHGNDGAGSIRVPASCCGLVGLKPSRGRTPCGPDMGELMFGMAYEFGLTRTVRDAAHYLDAIQGPGIGDKYTAPPPRRPYADELTAGPAGLRVAVTTFSWSGSAVDPEVADATVRAGRMLQDLGHHVTDASPVVDWEAVIQAIRAEAAAIAAALLLAPRQPDPARLEAVSRQVLQEARELTALELMAGLNAQNAVTRAAAAFFAGAPGAPRAPRQPAAPGASGQPGDAGHDLLVTPVLGQLPAPHGTLQYDNPDHTLTSWLRSIFDYAPFTALFNVSGQPAISLPLACSRDGLPIGVQLVAPYGREDLLLQVAAQLEQAMPWKDRVPPGFVGGR